MGTLIAKRYELLFASDEANDLGFQSWLAQDLQSVSRGTVHLCIFEAVKQNELIHHTFFRRAKELSKLSHPIVSRLVDFGFDEEYAGYYVVYERTSDTSLIRSLNSGQTPTFAWCLYVLLEICDALIYLEAHDIAHGSLYAENVRLDVSGGLPLTLREWGLRNLFNVLVVDELEPDDDLLVEAIDNDISGLGEIACQLITSKNKCEQTVLKEKAKQTPQTFRTFLKRCLSEKNRYTSTVEAQQDLLRSLTEHQSKTTFYLIATKNAAERLVDIGFIDKPEIYLANDLLNDELEGEVYGRAHEGYQGLNYYLITARFRLFCVPDRQAPERNLVITTVECPPPTMMIVEREQGLLIGESLKVASYEKMPKRPADINKLLSQLDSFRLKNQARKKIELAKKNGLDVWIRVLALQKRLLSEFKLSYSSWEITDSGAALLVELNKEPEAISLAGDEYLCMSSHTSHQSIVVGFYEELDGKTIRIGLARDVDVDDIAKSGSITLDTAQIHTILERQEEALRKLKFDEAVNPNLRRLLTEPNTLTTGRPSHVAFLNNLLDASQQEAVCRALVTHDVFLVQGPPGTGKTTAIVEIVRQALAIDPQARVLIASQSNVAVNHALLTLLDQAPELRQVAIRIGREEKAGATQDILLHQQLERWVEHVKKRSQNFIEKKKEEVMVDSELVDILSIIQECDENKSRTNMLQVQITQKRAAYESVNEQVTRLHRLLSGLQGLRQQTQTLLGQITSGDEELQRVMDSFTDAYLNWGESFLRNADDAVQLSARRVQLQDELEKLTVEHSTLEQNTKAGESLVQEMLKSKFQVALSDLIQQRRFIESKLSRQQNSALKLGRLQKVAKDWEHEMNVRSNILTQAYLSKASVIGATCIGIAAKGDVSEMEFDWVIVDEAGRATHPEIIVPLVRGRKLVLVGDHRQLPPILDRDLKQSLLEEIGVTHQDLETSLFQEMINSVKESIYTTLRVQYRMHPAIGNLISNCFYEGVLQNGITSEERQHDLGWCPTSVIWYSTHRLHHNQEKRFGLSYQNVTEVNVIRDLLERMEEELSRKNKKKQVGVITGYTAQKYLLHHEIEYTKNRWPHLDLEINTIDAYQGREMDFIIYSLVRSNPAGNIGFLRDSRRINVALSRARELLIIVGDHQTAETASTYGSENPFYTVLKHIRQHPDECMLEDVQI